MFKFKNIDSFTAGRFERMGMLKGKRWYTGVQKTDENENEISLVLFKPKRKEYGDKKVFCANHYGEFVGYLLALGSRTPACKVELAHLSCYYENIHKERNNGTPEEKDGCISYSHLEKGEILHHGKLVVDEYLREYPRTGYEFSRHYENNIDICIAAIEEETRNFYRKTDIKRSEEYVEAKVLENRKAALNMIIYDCLYGNNDRHDENWAMVKKMDGTDISLYPLYDNERVLGLYENIRTIESSLANNSVENDSEKILFSRMTVPDEKERSSSYKDVLMHIISTYSETDELLEKHLKGNPPMKLRMYLESLEGLPRVYIDYGSRMYESRYNFAKELVRKHRENKGKSNVKTFQENPDDLDNR